jgi:hypothetical protein
VKGTIRRIAGLGFSLAVLAPQPAFAETIQLEPQHGIFMLPVRINDAITIPFVLDSGSGDISVPEDVFKTLIRTRTVTESDLLAPETYVLADGSKHLRKRFVLHELRVGDHVVNDVTASVAPDKADPLLGQSFLSKLPGWTIDNAQHALVLGDAKPPNDYFANITPAPPPGAIPPPPGLTLKPPHPMPPASFDPSKPYTGIRNYTDGGHYEGEFLNDKRSGRGSTTWANGDR